MNDNLPLRLVLEEHVEVYVGESGEERPLNLDLDADRSRSILSALSDVFGEPERDRKTTKSSIVEGHSFGGHDVLQTVIVVAFLLNGAGLTRGAFTLLRAWLDLRRERSVLLEIGSGKTKRKISLKAVDFDDLPLKIQKLFLAEGDKDVKAPAKKTPRKTLATKPVVSARPKTKRPAKK